MNTKTNTPIKTCTLDKASEAVREPAVEESTPCNVRPLNLDGASGNEPVCLQLGDGGEFNHH